METTDNLTKTVQQLCNQYQYDTDRVALNDIMEFNDIIDDIFDGFTQDYEDGINDRDLTLAERGQILDALRSVYFVLNMSEDEVSDYLFSEYID